MTTSILSRVDDDAPPVKLRYEAAGWRLTDPGPQTLLAISPANVTLNATEVPLVQLPVPSLGSAPVVELWGTSAKAKRLREAGLIASRTGGLLLGAIVAQPDENLSEATRRIYAHLLELTRSSGTPHLIRIWNYFPGINVVDEIERYQQFCIARFEAFRNAGYDMTTDLPAASAVGSSTGTLTVVFLASSRKPRYVENPRQISAYSYPQRYGPRSPSFSRAALMGDGRTLLVSGTASIVGHQTVHRGNVSAQTDETLRNIDTVVTEAFGRGWCLESAGLESMLRVYVRHPADQPVVAARLERLIPPQSISYLHADICRSDLLVEIEAFIRRR